MVPISLLQIEVCHAKSNRHLASLSEISSKSTIKDVKEAIGLAKRKYADINRQELRLEPKGKFLKDEVTLEDLGLNTGEFDIAKRGFLKNTYHKPMGASYKDRIPWGLLGASYIDIT